MDIDQLIEAIDRVKLYKSQVEKIQEEITAQEEYASNAQVAIIKLNITLTAIQAEFDTAVADLTTIVNS